MARWRACDQQLQGTQVRVWQRVFAVRQVPGGVRPLGAWRELGRPERPRGRDSAEGFHPEARRCPMSCVCVWPHCLQ